MDSIKKLAGQTAIYGIPSIVGRILGYLLVPLYTRVFTQAEYGSYTIFYSYIAFFLIILTYGMETAFFRFAESTKRPKSIFSIAQISIYLTTLAFLGLTVPFSGVIARLIDYPDSTYLVRWTLIIIGFDVVTAVPFARLRFENKAIRFATLKMINIISNISLNLFFILFLPDLISQYNGTVFYGFISWMYRPDWSIEYVFIANLISSFLTMALLSKELFNIIPKFEKETWKILVVYGLPLMLAGFAGIVNETIDRLLLRYILSSDIAEQQVGIYSACYKIAIIMSIFIQAFRYSAEPFFFRQAGDKNSPQLYSVIMNYFVIACSVIFLLTLLYQEIIIHFIGQAFREGAAVIPVLLLSHLFLGIYFNLSIWYKLTNQTRFGAYIALIGSAITVVLNLLLIPHFGYMGSAWVSLICYFTMMMISYFWGQKYFPIPYDKIKMFGYPALALVIYLISTLKPEMKITISLMINSLLLFVFLIVVWKYDLKKIIHL